MRSKHLPRPDLAQLIGQRHDVLRGRELTWWERKRRRMPYIDWLDVMFFTMAATAIISCVIIVSLVAMLTAIHWERWTQ